MTLDRKSISVIVLPALFFIIAVMLIFRLTYTCPDGRGVVLTRPGMDGKKVCEAIIKREQLQREMDKIRY